MKFTEILKANNVSDEDAAKIISDMRTNKIYTSGVENADVRYNKLKADNGDNVTALNEANATIATLQAQLAETQKQNQQLTADNAAQKLDQELDRALNGKVKDIDYAKFKLKENHPDDFKLDDNGHISGIDELLETLKTQLPDQFNDVEKVTVLEHRLETSDDDNKGITLDEFKAMSNADRTKLYNDDPDSFNKLAKEL